MVDERFITTFSYYLTPSYEQTVDYSLAIDLDQDGYDEVVFYGFETQRNTPEEYDNTGIKIFGWADGEFVELTDKWLPNGTDRVEAVGEVVAGDFNGDGRSDLFLSANADMDHLINAYALINQGSSFEKVNLGLSEWEHGAGSYDINQDGYDDVLVATLAGKQESLYYLGSGNGLVKEYFPFAARGGSDVAAGFFSDNETLIVVTDSGNASQGTDNHVVRLTFDLDGRVSESEIVQSLPLDPIWGDNAGAHTVRAIAWDYSGDGYDDIVLFTQEGLDTTGLPNDGNVSTVSFFLNNGKGRFSADMNRLVGYDRATEVAYDAQVIDIDRDGRDDLFVSEGASENTGANAAFLLQDDTGQFVDTGRSHLQSFLSRDDFGTLLNTPDGIYMVRLSPRYEFTGGNSVTWNDVYLSDLSKHWNEMYGLDTPVRSSEIQAIGYAPDGQSIVIKARGLDQTLRFDDQLTLLDKTLGEQALSQGFERLPVFSLVVSGKTEYVLPEKFTGPASLGLNFQLIDDTQDAVVIGSSANDFIKLSSITSKGKAIDAGGGDDVVDGGVGSTFVTGGGGTNTFFLDGRAEGVSWSTITDFKLGDDKATIWGWKAGVSQVKYIELQGGADGYQGVTFHFENLLPSESAGEQINASLNSLTVSGMTLTDFGVGSVEELNAQIDAGTNPIFRTGVSEDEFGAHGYLLLG